MKKILLLAFAGVFMLQGYSQNYQTVNSSEVKLFEFNASTIRGYRIDSVMIDGVDSLLYPSRSIQKIDQGWECFDPLGPSMLGDYIRILPDGDNLFFNQNGDTIRIETRAQINDSWIFWSGTDFEIFANVLSISQGNVFGAADSIKIIRLNAFDHEMNPYPEFQFEGDTLRLSKNYGLLNTFNFYAFPNYYEEYFGLPAVLYSLYGIESQGLGQSNLTTFRIYDFQPGDELHVETEYLDYGMGWVNQVVDHFTSRHDYLPDSIVYGLNKTVIHFNYVSASNPIITNTTSPTTITIKPSPLMDQLPTLPFHDSTDFWGDAYYSTKMVHDYFLKKLDLNGYNSGGLLIFDESQDCFDHPIDGVCGWGEPDEYYEGLGGPYFFCDGDAASIRSRQLRYYMKDSVEWGTPFDLTLSVSENENGNLFEIFPNPASENLNITTVENLRSNNLVIFDVRGREVLSRKLISAESQLDISGLQSGVYFVQLTVSGNVSTRKLVVE